MNCVFFSCFTCNKSPANNYSSQKLFQCKKYNSWYFYSFLEIDSGLGIEIEAPFFDDPAPDSDDQQAFLGRHSKSVKCHDTMVALMYFDTMQSVSVIPGLSFSAWCLLALARLNPVAGIP